MSLPSPAHTAMHRFGQYTLKQERCCDLLWPTAPSGRPAECGPASWSIEVWSASRDFSEGRLWRNEQIVVINSRPRGHSRCPSPPLSRTSGRQPTFCAALSTPRTSRPTSSPCSSSSRTRRQRHRRNRSPGPLRRLAANLRGRTRGSAGSPEDPAPLQAPPGTGPLRPRLRLHRAVLLSGSSAKSLGVVVGC